jgi:hypothetical protein
MRETRSLLSSAFMQETCHDLLRDHLSIRQLTWPVTMSASDRRTMSVYLRAKFENELGVAVGTILTNRPPHRSVRAELPHTALPLDSGVEESAHSALPL